LSSGCGKGTVAGTAPGSVLLDPARAGEPANFWAGCALRAFDAEGRVVGECRVLADSPDQAINPGRLTLDSDLPSHWPVGTPYELDGGEPAPVLAIRTILGLPKGAPLPPVSVRLGTTRGTNALLTRRGARVAFVTTRGFADVLRIANQDRPRLFDLDIRKPAPLFETVVEIDERLDATGAVLVAPCLDEVRRDLERLRKSGIESLAICLLHAFANPAHEELVAGVAREVGFREVSVSSRLARLIRIVSRGDTTVVDAYLNPVLREYVDALRAMLGESSLRLMTSAGGLVDADRFVGKDSILSGPAGGVIGFSRVAERAGFAKSIGFDMGGTSTDVSRYDGRYELEYETRKAGVRIVAPMLAVETVAAGGGSLCAFDGVKLVVGPASAGANPGPACYGRGGPLTITDVNLFLGRVLPERFPFALDREAVRRRLQQVFDEVRRAEAGGVTSLEDLAFGFVRIANANMVRPIRNISVARGYDPREYTLVTFGGAGGQHACAVARELGMRRVLSHPHAGLLSAYGIGHADIRRHGERAVLAELSPATLSRVREVIDELAAIARNGVVDEGIPVEHIAAPRWRLELRYLGAEGTIAVEGAEIGPAPFAESSLPLWRTAFERDHRRLYGYIREGRGLEVVAARVEVVGAIPTPDEPVSEVVERRPEPTSRTVAWFDGAACSTAVFTRAELRAGDELPGPAILCEPSSTLVIEPGWTARILSRGEVLVEDFGGAIGMGEEAAGEITCDPVLLEIFNNQFASIAEGMGLTLQRTSCSVNVKERLDFSCAIFDARGGLVVNAPHIPVHLGAMGESVKRVLEDNPHPQPGDVFVTNDPYRGGSHLPDVTVVTPVHDETTGDLLFLTASRAHHAEIGGIVPGSMPPFSKTLEDEGVRIRNFKLVDAGVSREEALRELLLSGRYPTRNVADNLADTAAQVAANRTGADRLRELVVSRSRPLVAAYMEFIQRAAERKMRMALARLPDGEYRRTDHLDDGSPIVVTITKSGETARIDFAGTGPVLTGNLNANRAIVTAAVLYVFRCLIDEDIPLNAGVLAPLEIVLPECLLNPSEGATAAECPAVVGGNVETSQRVVDVLLGALGLAAGSQGTMNNFTFGDGTFGYYETICGGAGATPNADGADAVHTHMTNTRLTDVEVIERRYPVRIREFSIRRGSGGAGRHSGGDGIRRVVEFLKPLSVSLLTERRGPYPPYGLDGGSPGQIGSQSLRRSGSEVVEPLPGKVQLSVHAGDVLTIETPGGGGVGNRDAEAFPQSLAVPKLSQPRHCLNHNEASRG
jgi:5-oxoprolinase (ATP-hydrolysing)